MRWEMNSESGPRRNFRPAGSLAWAATRWETRPGTCSPSVAAAGTSRADLADGSIDDDGCLVCPWHGSKYDVGTGRMVRGPQGIFAKVPGLGAANMLLTRVLPLRRGKVEERDGSLYVC